MTFCTNCGAQNTDDTVFCSQCGARLTASSSDPVPQPVYASIPDAASPMYGTTPYPAQPDYTQPYQMEQPPKKKKKGLIIGISVGAVALVILVLVAALSMSGSNDARLGKYAAVSAQMYGVQMTAEEAFGGEFSIELKELGLCTVTTVNETGGGTWSVTEDGKFTIEDGQDSFSGTLIGDEITLVNVAESGLDITFKKVS